MWYLPQSGIKSVSPALAGGCSSTLPPRRPHQKEYKWGPSMESRPVLLKYLSFSLISNSPFLTLSPQISSCHPPILPLLLPAAPPTSTCCLWQSCPQSPSPLRIYPCGLYSIPLPFPWFSNDLIWTFPALLHSWMWVDGRDWAAQAVPNLAARRRGRAGWTHTCEELQSFSPYSQMCKEDVAFHFSKIVLIFPTSFQPLSRRRNILAQFKSTF